MKKRISTFIAFALIATMLFAGGSKEDGNVSANASGDFPSSSMT